MSAPLLRTDAITAGYGATPVVRDVTLQLASGELVGLLGRNGAGKTTLLRVLAGMKRPTAGQAWLGDRPIADVPRREFARRVAVVAQEPEETLPFRVGEVVLMGRTPRHGRFGFETAEDIAATERAMVVAEVDGLADRYPDQLSGGEWQRVRVARALAQEPELLLLDEPTAHLDLHARWSLYELIDRLRSERGCGVLVISHDLHPLLDRADRVLLLAHGRLVADGPAADVATPERLAEAFDVPLAAVPSGAAAPNTDTEPPDSRGRTHP